MNKIILVLPIMLSGCAEIITSVAVQGGVQVAGEEYLITKNKPIIRCNVANIIKGNNMCRIKRFYRVKV